MKKINKFEELPHFRNIIENKPDFHSVMNVKFGELIYDKIINWNEEKNEKIPDYTKLTWNWKSCVYIKDNNFNAQQELYDRLCNKIEGRYFDRDISLTPVWQWKREFIRTIYEIMPKYNKLYAIIDDVNILQTENKYGKKRSIASSFPQTLLNNESDYASSGVDKENEDIIDGDIIKKLKEHNFDYNDVDVMVLNDLEILFSPFISVSVNGI